MAASVPELAQRCGQPHRLVGMGGDPVAQGGAQVVEIACERVEACAVRRCPRLRCQFFRQRQETGGVSVARSCLLAGCNQTVVGIVPNRLEQGVACGIGLAKGGVNKTFVDQRFEFVGRIAEKGDSVGIEAAGKGRQPAQQLLLARRQEQIAAMNGVCQRVVAHRQIAGAVVEHVQPVVAQACQQRLGV